MKLKTINVVETIDGQTPAIHSFTHDDTGRKQAQACFEALAHGEWSLEIVISEWRGLPVGTIPAR